MPAAIYEETHRGKTVAPRLHENVNDNAILINGSPKIKSDAIDSEEHLVQMPFVTSPSSPPPQAGGKLATEFVTPASHSLVADQYTASSYQLFNVAIANAEPVVQPYAM